MTEYQKVIRGRGRIAEAPRMAEKMGITKPLIVGSPRLAGSLLKKAPQLLTSPVFSGYHPNPDLQDVLPAIEMYKAQHCDGIISIGGGSAMDTAKAVKAVFYAGNAENALAGRYTEPMDMPHLAIPGTAGTGAEATQNAVVYIGNKKWSLNDQSLRPDGVILDADLLDSLPIYHKKASALDALSQGIESYWSIGATEDSRIHAFLAILGVLDNLNAYLSGDQHAAEEMMDASFQSGKAIQITRTTAAHAMSYQLTKTMGYAHGHACMLTLPSLWEEAARHENMNPLLQDLSRKMRLGDQQMVPRLLRGILYDLELEIPIMPCRETLDSLAASVNTERLGNHPVRMNTSDVRKVYELAFTPLCETEKQACIDIWKYYGT